MGARKELGQRIRDNSVVSAAGCWEWKGYINHNGYGKVVVNDTTRRAHRVSYEHFVGPLTPGLTLDHLCRNRRCVNPTHLEEVTLLENNRRGMPFRPPPTGRPPSNPRKPAVACPQGHPYEPPNISWDVSSSGTRFKRCKICIAARGKAHRAKKRAAQ